MTAGQALSLIRKLARKGGYRVEGPLTSARGRARGKGSHATYALCDSTGAELVRFGLTGHTKDMSWTVLGQLEQRLTPYFGEKWTEKR